MAALQTASPRQLFCRGSSSGGIPTAILQQLGARANDAGLQLISGDELERIFPDAAAARERHY